MIMLFFFFQAEDGIRDLVRSRGLGDVYKRQVVGGKEVVDTISKVPSGDRFGLENVPLEDVVLKKAEEVQ